MHAQHLDKDHGLYIYVGRGRCNHRRGHNQRRFVPSCFRLVYFLRKSTGFHVMRMECQRTIFYFLLLVSHKYPAIDKALPYSVFAPDLSSPIRHRYDTQLMVYIKRR